MIAVARGNNLARVPALLVDRPTTVKNGLHRTLTEHQTMMLCVETCGDPTIDRAAVAPDAVLDGDQVERSFCKRSDLPFPHEGYSGSGTGQDTRLASPSSDVREGR